MTDTFTPYTLKGENMAREKVKVSGEEWDARKLGADMEFAKAADASEGIALDEALDLQMISIRLPKNLISQLKLIAHFNGIGYQPLMRDVLSRFARSEVLELVRQQAELARLEKEKEEAAKKIQKKAA